MKFKNFLNSIKLSLLPLALTALALFAGRMLFDYVDLRPQVEPNFFFSDSDPQFKKDLQIKEMFPEPEQIIIAAKGNFESPAYRKKIREMSIDLLGLAPVFALQSIYLGPEDAGQAFESPLWHRLLFSKDGHATLLILYTRNVPKEDMYTDIEQIARHYEDPGFEVIISGAPYIIDLIRRELFRDLKVFCIAALFIFTAVMLTIFKSLRILLGTVVTCVIASVATLFAAKWLQIGIGPLTANLSTMVFVLTLSHIAYMTFNWKHSLENRRTLPQHPVLHAAKYTVVPSFWSMLTTLLGFVTLIFVEAAPFRKLGISGAIGTLIAFGSAYLFFPWFLAWKTPHPGHTPAAKPGTEFITQFLSKKHPLLTTLVFAAVIAAAFGISKINRDPHLLSYFKSGTELREGLDYIDTNWGSSPLKIVIRDEQNRLFNSEAVQKRLYELQQVLEKNNSVGNLVSLSLILEEAQQRTSLSYFINLEKFIKELEKPKYNEIAKQFVTPDRNKSLLLLRMKSLDRVEPRTTIIDRLKTIIRTKGFEPELIGGLYFLQGEMGRVVISSLFSGLALLIILFFVMGLYLSRSLHVTGAMFMSLVIIPAWLLGLLGFLKIPLDMISAPAANLAVAMGVDAMIHLLIMVRHCHKQDIAAWDGWIEARARLWRPILTSATVVCAGFAIFTLSYFPPTQRFGLSVILGSFMAAVAALFILPTLAGTHTGGKENKKNETL